MQIKASYSWDDLQLLLVLTRRGSLKAAAVELSVNISTVARRLDAFEASIGQHLFDRCALHDVRLSAHRAVVHRGAHGLGYATLPQPLPGREGGPEAFAVSTTTCRLGLVAHDDCPT